MHQLGKGRDSLQSAACPRKTRLDEEKGVLEVNYSTHFPLTENVFQAFHAIVGVVRGGRSGTDEPTPTRRSIGRESMAV